MFRLSASIPLSPPFCKIESSAFGVSGARPWALSGVI
jgi:hypothetical protein